MGGADVVVQFDHGDLANGDTINAVLRRLPPRSRAVNVRERLALVPARDGDAIVDVTDLPLDDALATHWCAVWARLRARGVRSGDFGAPRLPPPDRQGHSTDVLHLATMRYNARRRGDAIGDTSEETLIIS
jgi:hypothetical protein